MLKFMGLFVGLAVGGFGSTIRNTWPESQYHNQDSLGSYRYGYTSPYHSKSETRTNGITQGGYSYIDANGILQAVQYTADDVNGFRISGSNIPKQIENNNLQLIEKSDIAESQKNHISQYDNNNENPLDAEDISKNELIKNPYLLTKTEASSINVPVPTNMHLINKQYGYYNGNNGASSSALPIEIKSTQPVASSSWILPVSSYPATSSFVPAATAFVPAAAAFVPARRMHSSLHHTQDSLGQYDYTYTGDTSAKSESRSLDGTTRGAYSYIDANGILQQVHYIADHNGFRVLATNLPS